MGMLIYIELQKIFKKWRTYIGFIAIGVLVPIVQLALYYEGDDYLRFATRSFSDAFVITGNLMNGYLIGNMVLNTLFIHIPFLIVLVGGDLLAGEATSGTYRLLITRPVSRFQIITSKFIAGFIYTISLLLFLMAISLGLSLLIFGSGELISLRRKIYIFADDDVLWRFFYAYGYALLSMTTVLALSFFFSSLVENAIGPIVATMAVIIIFIILAALNIEALDFIRPYLFTQYLDDWQEFFTDPVDYAEMAKSAVVLAGHILCLYTVTLVIFLRKDILS
ncbi:ABC transporter permease [Bacteroidota bacterium]